MLFIPESHIKGRQVLQTHLGKVGIIVKEEDLPALIKAGQVCPTVIRDKAMTVIN